MALASLMSTWYSLPRPGALWPRCGMSGSWTWLNTNYTYNDLGEILTSTDPLNHRTSYDYTDNWATSNTPSPVELAKSPRTIVSFSESTRPWRECQNNPPTSAAATATAIAANTAILRPVAATTRAVS